MTEPKLISPMLDNFVMGDPISDHDGVRCCPAIQKETDEKYIVKIISVPASEKQLEALLLSGAFSDKESALAYFSKLCDGIIEEVNVINKLSELEGYLPIEASQIEPMEDSSGFDVYLLSSYRNTLQRQLRRGTMTHLSALNLGLDLCAALAVARRMGYLYADLKPGNIYVDETQGYRIGDIGFLKLNSLKYTSLPDRYRSTYTAPEITDAFSELSTTTDVYAAGLILYQVFNDGNLPFTGDHAPSDIFPAPAYADYEMAEIILKACAPDPALRWQDPIELGQALVSYMQRNGAHDTPIVPVPEQEETAEQSDCEEEGAYMETQECATEDPASMEDAQQSTEAEAEAPEAAEPDDLEEVSEESIYAEDNEGNLTFLEDVSDETAEEQDADEIDYDEVTDEVSDMLQQADELIAHEAPAPVVQPEPIDVPMPPPIILEETAESEPVEEEEGQGEPDTAEAEADVTEDSNADVEQAEEEESDDDEHAEDIPETPHKRGGWILKAILVILAAALVAGGMYFYKTFYLQTVDAITLEVGEPGELTVNIHTQADENELSVVCTDIYGNQKTAVVSNGQAKFTDLKPNSAYAIKVNIGGFHKLIGKIGRAHV